MKRVSLQLGLSLITFSLGIGAAWSYPRLLRPALTAIGSALSKAVTPSEVVEISLLRSYRDEQGLIRAEFVVTNGGRETVYYQGYDRNDNQYWSVWGGGRLNNRHSPFCGTGLAERTLTPGESAKFRVEIGRGAGSVRVGFDITAGKKRLRRTIWSGDVHLPEY